jgi:hypothetical protein
MRTVYRFDGLRVVVYSNDHRPAHVHVKGAAGEAVFNLNCPGGPLQLRESHGFRLREARNIEKALASVLGGLCREWRLIHGRY